MMLKNIMKRFVEQMNILPSSDATSYPQARVFWTGKLHNESQNPFFKRWKDMSTTLFLKFEGLCKRLVKSIHLSPA